MLCGKGKVPSDLAVVLQHQYRKKPSKNDPKQYRTIEAKNENRRTSSDFVNTSMDQSIALHQNTPPVMQNHERKSRSPPQRHSLIQSMNLSKNLREKASPPIIPKQRSLMVAKSTTQSEETIFHERSK